MSEARHTVDLLIRFESQSLSSCTHGLSIVLSSGSVIRSIFSRKPGRKSWLKKRNARTRRARARSRQTASTAAHHVKELATQSSLIVIAVTKCVREISELELRLRCATFYCWCLAMTALRCSAIAGSSARNFCCCSCAFFTSPSTI